MILKLSADDGVEFKYSSTQFNMPPELSEKVIAWGKEHIPDENLHDDEEGSMGREKNIHCTLLYGIHSENPAKTSDALKDCKSVTFSLGKVSKFESDGYDVVKIEVLGDEIQDLHKKLKENVKNSYSYPKYQPHVTVAYVKKGTADDLMGDTSFEGEKILADGVLFSSNDGRKITIHLGDANKHLSDAYTNGFVKSLTKTAGPGGVLDKIKKFPTPKTREKTPNFWSKVQNAMKPPSLEPIKPPTVS